ncbi:oxidoreductase [Paenibacillus sp. 1-18]|uniref:oxidoreductase n=1 Tax=Paenibacillus sp. 1-18 TaxID=1333846 RepID=UPI0006764885|nr:hypothetical protein [Paenibacillus sp. 1-18]
MKNTSILAKPLILKNEVSIKNRFFKAAMSETLAEKDANPTQLLVNLYQTWARGGAGLVLTGNVMIDRRALGEPGNVVVEDERDLVLLEEWARAGTENGTHLWMQLNHPGTIAQDVIQRTSRPKFFPTFWKSKKLLQSPSSSYSRRD